MQRTPTGYEVLGFIKTIHPNLRARAASCDKSPENERTDYAKESAYDKSGLNKKERWSCLLMEILNPVVVDSELSKVTGSQIIAVVSPGDNTNES